MQNRETTNLFGRNGGFSYGKKCDEGAGKQVEARQTSEGLLFRNVELRN